MLSPRLSCVSGVVGLDLALQLAHRALQHGGVELEAHGLDVSALLAAQQIAGAAQLQVERRDLEARAQVAELFQRRQPASRQVGQVAVGRNQQVRIGAAVGAAHASAQLVQLRQAVAVGAIDDDGVAQRNVEPVLDDGGGDQDVGLVPHEGQHHALQFALAHLAVADENARLGHHLANLVGDVVDALHAVVHEVHLPAALQLLLDGRANQLLVPGRHHRLDRHAVFGRRLDHAHVAQAEQRHVQRARNRRGRHGEHVHFLAKLLEPLLVAHAEALLLIDDDQAEVAELHVLRQQAVRADHDVDLAGLELRQRFFLLLRRAEAAEHLDLDGEGREALLEGVEVLEGEHRGRREHRDLAAVAAPP